MKQICVEGIFSYCQIDFKLEGLVTFKKKGQIYKKNKDAVEVALLWKHIYARPVKLKAAKLTNTCISVKILKFVFCSKHRL